MKRKKEKIYWGMFVVIGLSVIGLSAFATSYYKERILPRVWINDVYVGGLDSGKAEKKVREKERLRYNATVGLNINGVSAGRPTYAEIGASPQVKTAIYEAMKYGKPRRGVSWIGEFVTGFTLKKIPVKVLIYQPVFDRYLTDVLNQSIKTPISANWTVSESGRLQFVPAQAGELINRQKMAMEVVERFNANSNSSIELMLISTQPEINDREALELKSAVEKTVGLPFVVKAREQTIEVPREIYFSWIVLERINGKPTVTFSRSGLKGFLENTVAEQVKKDSRDADFEMVDGKVTVFVPAQEGQALNVEESIGAIRDAVQNGKNEAQLALNISKSKVASTAEIERLGITDLLSAGETNFKGSPTNRVHNIKVGAARFNGILIPPGATFAFNENLGPVGKATGYKPELVIKEYVTTPEYGGGLCQVSTTAFRAAVLSGLEIVERSNHAYPVAYYGAPGFDATIYPNQQTWKDGTDLKFINDTPGHILIQTKVEGTKLIFEFWGTSDEREVKVVGPTSYDKAANGSVKARLVQQIFRAGELAREDVILSSYKSPALFPHVLAANAERPVATMVPTPAPTPKPSAAPTVKKTNP